MLLDWLNNRGSDKDLEERNILSRLQHFFESHGKSRFSEWDEDIDVKTYNRAGFKKNEGMRHITMFCQRCFVMKFVKDWIGSKQQN